MVAPQPATSPPLLLLLSLAAGQGQEQDQTTDWRATLQTIRNGIHKIDTYLNTVLDLLGGKDWLSQYKCRPIKASSTLRIKTVPPNGYGSPLFGVHLNIGIPSLTKCCNQHDRCYETCGKCKNDCDKEFQYCLSKICRDVQKALGLAQNVQACETTVELLFDSVITFGLQAIPGQPASRMLVPL